MTGDHGQSAPRYRVAGHAALPPAIRPIVAAAAKAAVSIGRAPDVLNAYLAVLDAMPTPLVPQFARLVASELSTASWRKASAQPGIISRLSTLIIPGARPSAARSASLIADGPAVWLHLFDSNGYARAAALARMSVPASPARLAALMLRLDDWVAEVRNAAQAAFARHGEAIPDSVILSCLPFLAARLDLPSLDPGCDAAIRSLINRTSLDAPLAARFALEQDSATWRIFRFMLRTDRFDPLLVDLASTARHPAIRALALKSVLTGIVEGYPEYHDVLIRKGRSQTNRVLGKGRRSCQLSPDPGALIRAGAADRALTVRKAAADGLIHCAAHLPDVDALISAFGDKPGASVKDRLDFVRRRAEAARAAQPLLP